MLITIFIGIFLLYCMNTGMLVLPFWMWSLYSVVLTSYIFQFILQVKVILQNYAVKNTNKNN